MLDNKQIEISSNVIKEAIVDGIIIKPENGRKEFFLKKSIDSIDIAERLMKLKYQEHLNTNMWIINISYYSMFFAATALLAKYNHKIDSEVGIHKLTYHALVYYFIKEENKLKIELAKEYKHAVDDAQELLQIGERKINELIQNLNFEQEKRKRYTYEMGEEAEEEKAKTSLERAKKFVNEIRNI